MKKTIWSSNGELDSLLDLSSEDKRDYLAGIYDREFVDDLGDNELDHYIQNNLEIIDNAADDFESNIAPIIANQVDAGLVMDENFHFVDPSALLSYNGYLATLDEDENGELWFSEEGRKPFPILGFSPDQEKFILQLDRLGILDTIHNLYPDWKDEDIDVYDIVDLVPHNWALLEEVLTRPAMLEDFREDVNKIDEASVKNAKGLKKELKELKELSAEYGREYFTQMPFTSFDNDPMSIEMQYPEFFRVVKAFFKEMEVLSPEELKDPDVLDMSWDQDISQHDWDTLMETCERLVKTGKPQQIEKIYKNNFDDHLGSDDDILAAREKEEAEFEESIDEKAIDPALKGQKPKKVDKFEYSMSKDAVKRVADIIYNEMEESDFDLLNDIGFDAYIDKDPEAIKQVKELFKKYGLPMWALKVFCEAWDDDYNESLTEGANDELAMQELKETVANYIYDFYLADVDDNIAQAVRASIPSYNIDWCNEEGDNFIANGVDQMKHALARKITDALFANAPRELGESLNEGFLEKVILQLYKDGIYAYEVGGSTLENKYGYYQGDVILEDDASQAKLKELGIKPGDKFVVGVNDDEENTVTILSKVNESLTEDYQDVDLSKVNSDYIEQAKGEVLKNSQLQRYKNDDSIDQALKLYTILRDLDDKNLDAAGITKNRHSVRSNFDEFNEEGFLNFYKKFLELQKSKDIKVYDYEDERFDKSMARMDKMALAQLQMALEQSKNESLTEEIWHNRGAGDCQIIERSASGRNALLKRLADGALQPYVIALNMGKDSWGQGKYYTELEDARRDWKRYKFD